MSDTKRIGNISETQVLAALIKSGIPCLLPFGDNERYDIVIESANGFKRIQVKTGRISKSSIEFPTGTCSRYREGRRGYHGEVDYFGVYCPDNGKCYLVPIEECGISSKTLRLEKSLNGQSKNINYAVDYELEQVSIV